MHSKRVTTCIIRHANLSICCSRHRVQGNCGSMPFVGGDRQVIINNSPVKKLIKFHHVVLKKFSSYSKTKIVTLYFNIHPDNDSNRPDNNYQIIYIAYKKISILFYRALQHSLLLQPPSSLLFQP